VLAMLSFEDKKKEEAEDRRFVTSFSLQQNLDFKDSPEKLHLFESDPRNGCIQF
jgi:hypothetical protein